MALNTNGSPLAGEVARNYLQNELKIIIERIHKRLLQNKKNKNQH